MSLHFYLLLTQTPPAADARRWVRERVGQVWDEFLRGLACQMSQGTSPAQAAQETGEEACVPSWVGTLMKAVRIASPLPDPGAPCTNASPAARGPEVWSVLQKACYLTRQSAKTKVLTEYPLDDQDSSKVTQ